MPHFESDSASGASQPPLGQWGDYDLLREVGRGGMGVVYEAIHRPLGRRVALKVLPDGERLHRDALARFQREAEIAAKLAHPGICTVFEAGVVGSAPFIAMQFIDGESLAERIEHRASVGARGAVHVVPPSTRLDPQRTVVETTSLSGEKRSSTDVDTSPQRVRANEVPELVHLIERAALALHAAHEAGILHRDVKPANLLIAKDGSPVLVDFGVARSLESEAHELTRPGDLIGTPAYFAPEQIRWGRSDRRSDVYALGVSLYQALAGVRPFRGPTREALFREILRAEAVPLRRAGVPVSRDLETVVATAMEREPVARYATALDFAEDLRRVREGKPVLARPPGFVGRGWRFAKRRPAASALALAILMLIAGAASFAGYVFATRDDLALAREETERRAEESLLSSAFFQFGFGDTEASLSLFERARQRRPSAESVAGLAMGLIERGRANEALAVLEGSGDLIPRVPSLQVLVRNAREKLGLPVPPGSMDEPKPESSLDYFVRGFIRHAQAVKGDRQAGRDAYRDFTEAAALSDRPRLIVHVLRTWSAGLSGDAAWLDQSEATMFARWPADGDAWLASGFGRSAAKDYARAAVAFERVISIDPSHPEAWARLADMWRRTGDLVGAERAARRAVELGPRLAMTHWALGLVREAKGRPAEAEACYLAGLELDPDSVFARKAIARQARALNKPEEAARWLTEAQARDPKDAEALYLASVYQCENGQLEAGVAGFKKVLELDPQHVNALDALAHTLGDVGDPSGALAAARRAAELNPTDPEAAYAVGAMLAHEGPPAEAEAALKRALALRPAYPEAEALLGLVHLRQGRFLEADAVLARTGLMSALAPALGEEVLQWQARARNALALIERLRAEATAPALDSTALQAALLEAADLPLDRATRALLARLWERVLDHLPETASAPFAVRQAAAMAFLEAGESFFYRVPSLMLPELRRLREQEEQGRARSEEAAAFLAQLRGAMSNRDTAEPSSQFAAAWAELRSVIEGLSH